MRLLIGIVLTACGSRTSIEVPEPPRTAAPLAQRIASIERPALRSTEISGVVLDANGDHVEGVLVELLVGGEPFENTTSDGNGRYEFAVPPGAYHLRFHHDDWRGDADIVAVSGERASGPTMVVERLVPEIEVVPQHKYLREVPEPISFGCGGSSDNNTYYIEGISTEGLVFGDPIPTGRTFEGTLGAAGHGQGDDEQVSFSSHHPVENTYVVDEPDGSE